MMDRQAFADALVASAEKLGYDATVLGPGTFVLGSADPALRPVVLDAEDDAVPVRIVPGERALLVVRRPEYGA
jgi:hypothetical protein